MMPLLESESFTEFSRWAPRSAQYWALRPQKALRRWASEYVPLAVRVWPSGDPSLTQRPTLVWWSYNRKLTGDRLFLTFESSARLTNLDARWRVVATALWRLIRKHPTLAFQDVAVDLGDGCGPETPDFVFTFARPIGAANALLPNPYLLQDRKPVPAPLSWEAKTDTLYFRGADSGSPDLELNTRVALCRTAKALPRTDCRLTRLVQSGEAFREQLRQEGLVGRRVAIPEMNRHRFLMDTDGNTTSWDRYMLIGTFQAVPILFEPAWEECWHGHLADGENCIVTDRTTLGATLAKLRSTPDFCRHLAAGASKLAAERLSPAGAQILFEAAWLQRCEGL